MELSGCWPAHLAQLIDEFHVHEKTPVSENKEESNGALNSIHTHMSPMTHTEERDRDRERSSLSERYICKMFELAIADHLGSTKKAGDERDRSCQKSPSG